MIAFGHLVVWLVRFCFTQFFPDRIQPLNQLGLKSAIDGSIVFPLDPEVILRSDAVLCVMRIFVSLPVTDAASARIMTISQMDGDG